MNKWIAEFDLEEGDTMPEHMDLEYKGARIDFHCRPMWIPVSERLPEEDTDVLVTLECGLIGIMQKKLSEDDNGEPCYIWQDFEGEEHEVIAWMPLPKPYSEGEE